MIKYIVTKDTYAIVPNYNGSTVYGKYGIKSYDESTKKILERSCKYYGCDLNARIEGAREVLGIVYKTPIIVSEKNKIIMFPTGSIRCQSCAWINLFAIKSYYHKRKDAVEITFIDDKKIVVEISFGVLDKQILRASRFDNIMWARKRQ